MARIVGFIDEEQRWHADPRTVRAHCQPIGTYAPPDGPFAGQTLTLYVDPVAWGPMGQGITIAGRRFYPSTTLEARLRGDARDDEPSAPPPSPSRNRDRAMASS